MRLTRSASRAETALSGAIERFIAGLQEELSESERKGARAPVERRKLRTVTALCGQKASTRFLTRLDEDLRAAGIYTEPSLVDSSLKLDDWVLFAKSPFLPQAIYFPKERDLQHFVEACIGSGPFRHLEACRLPGVKSGREFRLPSGRIDLLCQERSRSGQGALVAIEFKRKNDRGTVVQMVSYLNELRTLYPSRRVRGMIISGSDDPVAAAVLKEFRGHEIECLCYSVKFERTPDSP